MEAVGALKSPSLAPKYFFSHIFSISSYNVFYIAHLNWRFAKISVYRQLHYFTFFFPCCWLAERGKTAELGGLALNQTNIVGHIAGVHSVPALFGRERLLTFPPTLSSSKYQPHCLPSLGVCWCPHTASHIASQTEDKVFLWLLLFYLHHRLN